MREPKMPGWTCPIINRLKSNITESLELTNGAEEIESVDILLGIIEDIRHKLSDGGDILEDIRSANSKLRDCAEYWQEKTKELEGSQ